MNYYGLLYLCVYKEYSEHLVLICDVTCALVAYNSIKNITQQARVRVKCWALSYPQETRFDVSIYI